MSHSASSVQAGNGAPRRVSLGSLRNGGFFVNKSLAIKKGFDKKMSKEKFSTIQVPPGRRVPDDFYYEFEDIVYSYSEIKQFPLPGKIGLEKYLPLLPLISEGLAVTMHNGEGNTPLYLAPKLGQIYGLSDVYIKHEEYNPTGCFKDRESAVVMSSAVERGIDKVFVISSGNAALSTAAYAQIAGIECHCYVPEKTSHEKQDLIRLFGAQLHLLPGFYEDVYRRVIQENPTGWNVTTGQNEIRTEGDKTIAYEIFEQLGRVPNTIAVPCGNGGCLAGIWKGFKELQLLGKIDCLPQMVAVQVKNASPFKIALEQGTPYAILGDIEDSLAEGIVAQESYSSPKATLALRESGGYVVEVTDEEIKEALRLVIKQESVVPEPTSAAVYAALPKLRNKPDDRIVLINTGSGYKFLSEIAKLVI